MSEKRKYDSTIARIAGNIVSAWPTTVHADAGTIAKFAEQAVTLARAIVAEVERTTGCPQCIGVPNGAFATGVCGFCGARKA